MLSRIHRWSCDTSDETADYGGYGLPFGWMWYARDKETMHACPDCVAKMRNDGYGTAKKDPTQLTNVAGRMVT